MLLLRRRPRIQPIGTGRLDWSHPALAQAANQYTQVYLPLGREFYDVAQETRVPRNASASGADATPDQCESGYIVRIPYNGSNSNAGFIKTSPTNSPAAGFSSLLWIAAYQTPGTGVAGDGPLLENTSDSFREGISINSNAGTFTVQVRSGPFESGTQSIVTGNIPNRDGVLTAHFVAGTNSILRVYHNGILIGEHLNAGTVNSMPSVPFRILNFSNFTGGHGLALVAQIPNVSIPSDLARELSIDPWQLFYRPQEKVSFTVATGGSQILTADAGSIVITGQASGLAIGFTTSNGSYATSGQAGTLDVRLTADAGSIAVTGQAAPLVINFTADAGSFAQSGQAGTLNVTLTADAGAFTITGQDATLTATGQSNTNLVADAGSVAITGQDVTFLLGLTSGAGSYATGGQAGTLAFGMTSGAGTFTIAGQDATLTATAPFSLTADAGSIIITGQDANLNDSTPPISSRSAGSGGYDDYRTARTTREYRDARPLDDDYWETRERYIRRMLRTTEVRVHDQESVDALSAQPDRSAVPLSDVGASQDALAALHSTLARQNAALEIARNAFTRAELKRAGEAIVETSLALARLNDQHELEALAVLMASML